MKKYFFEVLVIQLLFSISVFSNNIFSEKTSNYPVSDIPDELLEEANAVVRLDHTEFELKSRKTATLKAKYVITILNQKANRHAHFVQGYDKFRKISSIKATVYNAYGKEIKKFKKKDIIDQSAISGISLYEDSRLKAIEVMQNQYPFTVEVEFEVEYKGLLIYPSWNIFPSYDVAIQQSSYKAIIPSSLGVRYKSINTNIEPKMDKNGNADIYFWSDSNLKAMKQEHFGPSTSSIFLKVILAPNEFEYDGHAGNMKDWKTYGQWMYQLLQGREELPEKTKAEVQKLVAGVNDEKEKVRLIYEYLQSKTRYISIQLGIGGLQPFKAEYVDKNGYGDCKALSNYTRAMLGSVNIPSYYATIGAGPRHQSIQPEFAWKGYTNHAVLCVPLEKDTIWLECTSQSNPFGYMGSFTGDRNAMLVTENGGVIVKTPQYPLEVNTQIRKATITLDGTGNAIAKINTTYGGLQYENVQWQFTRNDKEKKESLLKKLNIPNIEITNFDYSQNKAPIPVATEKLELRIRSYGSPSGKRLFVPLNILNKRKKAPAKIKDRKTDVVIDVPYIDRDTIVYEFPDYFTVESLPKLVKIESDFGTYSSSVVQEGNKVTYIRTMTMNKKTFPPERYPDLITFISVLKTS